MCIRDRDIIIKAAAVADYRPDHPVDEKVKKKDGDATLTTVSYTHLDVYKRQILYYTEDCCL